MNNNKKILYGILLFIGVIAFVLQIFIFSYPDGLLGLILCITSTELIIFSTIKLYKLSDDFKEFLKKSLDILFKIN